MAHPRVENETPFAFEALFTSDEDGRPLVVPIIRGVFDFGGTETPRLAEVQPPIQLGGEFSGEPGASSPRFEPEFAFEKPGTDVALLGHAWARAGRAQETAVELCVGSLVQRALVTGDRIWRNGLLKARPTEPEPFEKIPLVWERAFGGWDRAHADPSEHRCEPRNPLGVSFHRRRSPFAEGSPMPNIEDPLDRTTAYRGRSRPVGFALTGPEWAHRRKLAGTYDAGWESTRKPLLPVDFDRRFFQAAAPGLASSSPLRGDEPVSLRNLTPEGQVEFRLPGLGPPRCTVARRVGADVTLETRLDTIVIDADARRVLLTWRAHATLRDGPHDVSTLAIRLADDPASRALAGRRAETGTAT